MFLRLCWRAPRTLMRSIDIVPETEADTTRRRISCSAEPVILADPRECGKGDVSSMISRQLHSKSNERSTKSHEQDRSFVSSWVSCVFVDRLSIRSQYLDTRKRET